MNVGLVIPTCNAEKKLPALISSLHNSLYPLYRQLIIDSTSEDGTVNVAKKSGFEVLRIERGQFDHGATRQLGADTLNDCDVIIYMTQDAVLASNDSITNLVKALSDTKVGAAYGRQIPRIGAGILEAHARIFNYPANSFVKKWPEAKKYGIMAGAISNSFAAYRRSALLECGGFPSNIVCSEDVYIGFRMLFNNWHIAYVAESVVHHSHDYSPIDEFHRYFDIGAFYCAYEPWILNEVGKAESRGLSFLISQMKTAFQKAPWLIPIIITSAFAKYIGFRLGAQCKKNPRCINLHFGMNKSFWRRL